MALIRLLLLVALLGGTLHALSFSAGDSPVGHSAPTNPPPLADTVAQVTSSFNTEWLEGTLFSNAWDCMFADIGIGVSVCTYKVLGVPVPVPCIRVDMDIPAKIIEGSHRNAHTSVLTGVSAIQMKAALGGKAGPFNKTSDNDSGSLEDGGMNVGYGRNMGFPPTFAIVYQVAFALTAGNLCQAPFTLMGLGYNYHSEGDWHSKLGYFAGWRAIVSPYITFIYMAPMATLGKVMEYSGIGGVDVFGVLTHGSFGTAAVVNGNNYTTSTMTSMVESMMDAGVVNDAFFFTYGPLTLRYGPMIWPMHFLQSYVFGVIMLNAHMQYGGNLLWLWPGPDNDGPGDGCHRLKRMGEPGNIPIFAAVMGIEQGARVRLREANYAFAYFARVTCCNYCAGSDDAIRWHFKVGKGAWTQQIRK